MVMVTSSSATQRRDLYVRWAQLIDTILPASDQNRLVCVAQVGQSALQLVEARFAEVGITPILSETRSLHGETLYRILVPARDAERARPAATPQDAPRP